MQDDNQDLQRQIAELKAENLVLKEQLAAREQITAMIAHDLRGPLTPIINYAKLILRQRNPQSHVSLSRNASIIVSQAQRMTRLVGDLLDMSRISNGTFTLFREQCDIIALLKDIVDQLRPVAPRHTFVLDIPEGELMCYCDHERLQQALGNLLDNAVKYSFEGTSITVRAWTTPQTIHISVHNVGRDIPNDEKDTLFQPYVRLSAATVRKGSGLGLFIARSIIQEHGGDLHLDPYILDENANMPGMHSTGTSFSLTLPYEIQST